MDDEVVAPDDVELEASGAFRAHKQYLRSIAMLAGFDNNSTQDEGVYQAIADSMSASRTGRRQGVNLEQVKTSLTHAWSTELLVELTMKLANEDEFVRITNIWTAVQAYYVAYHSTQALCIAKGMPRPDSHPKTQKQYYSLWVSHPAGTAPWAWVFTTTDHTSTFLLEKRLMEPYIRGPVAMPLAVLVLPQKRSRPLETMR